MRTTSGHPASREGGSPFVGRQAAISRKDFLHMVVVGPVLGATVGGLACQRVPEEAGALRSGTCGVTPAVPPGPFYRGQGAHRSDIAQGIEGVPVEYRFEVVDPDCTPVSNAIVEIWHADPLGRYSGVRSQRTAGQDWLRGFQETGIAGDCVFQSIFPGWYSGRLTHVHGRTSINGIKGPTTNFFFPKQVEDAVFESPGYRGRGPNRATVDNDAELHGDASRFSALMFSVTGTVGGGLVAAFRLSIGSRSSGYRDLMASACQSAKRRCSLLSSS